MKKAFKYIFFLTLFLSWAGLTHLLGGWLGTFGKHVCPVVDYSLAGILNSIFYLIAVGIYLDNKPINCDNL